MKEFPINSMNDLAFEYGRAALFRRWLAAVIDLLIVTIFIVLVIGGAVNATSERLRLVWGILATAFWFGYYFFTESRWGMTPAKMLLGLRVIDERGEPPSMGKSAIRTAMRLVEVNPFLLGALPAAISIFTSSSSQRIGDRIAGTYVLLKKDLEMLPEEAKVDEWG